MDAAAFGAVCNLAYLFGGEFVFLAPWPAFFVTCHDAAEGLDLADDFGEFELLDLGGDLIGVFIRGGGFAEIGLATEPADVDVAGGVADRISTCGLIGELAFERSA